MEKIKINNDKETVYNCLECNKPLTDYEYNTCKIFCTSCFSKYYDRLSGSYNDVDEILMKKLKGDRRKMRCNNYGRERTRYDDEFCEECGVEFYGYYSWEREEIMAEYEGDLYYDDCNNIDNILEQKRADIKRRGTYYNV